MGDLVAGLRPPPRISRGPALDGEARREPGRADAALLQNVEDARRSAAAPNSPRDSGVGVVRPRAMKPDWVSKSKVRQTMWRGKMLIPMRHGRDSMRSGIECYVLPPSTTAWPRTVGIILNGATGRIGSTQHLANALAPIRDEGGLAGRRRPHRAALDAGGAQRRATRRARAKARRRVHHRSRRGAGRSGLQVLLRRRGDPSAPGDAGKGDRGRQAHLFREAGGADASPRAARCCAR